MLPVQRFADLALSTLRVRLCGAAMRCHWTRGWGDERKKRVRRNLSTKPQQKAKVPRRPSPFVTNPLPPVHVSGAINFMTLFKMNGKECATTYELFSRCREPSTKIITLLTIRKVDLAVVVFLEPSKSGTWTWNKRGNTHSLASLLGTLNFVPNCFYFVQRTRSTWQKGGNYVNVPTK